MTISLGRAALPPGGADYLRKLLDQPNQRAVVSRILNDESRKLKVICEQVAEESVHRRPDDRRTRESLAHGPEYHDSFEIVKAKTIGADKIKAGVENTHPFARAVEKGTPAHPIVSEGFQVFPWNGQRNGPNDGAGMGDFLVSGARNARARVVNHTGAGAKNVMRRARRRYLDQAKRRVNR